MILQDFRHYIFNILFMPFRNFRILKVLINQILSEFIEGFVFLPLFKGAVLSDPKETICEIPEFLGEFKPSIEGIIVIIFIVLNEC